LVSLILDFSIDIVNISPITVDSITYLKIRYNIAAKIFGTMFLLYIVQVRQPPTVC